MKLNFTLNGTPRSVYTEAGESVQKLLKRMGIFSVRDSDDNYGFAGSDTILLDGKGVCAGLLVSSQIEGKDVKTVESLSTDGKLSAVQSALIDAGVVQSAYNIPAAALVLEELLDRNENPSKEDVIDALSPIYIRDAGYQMFFDAVEIAKKRRKDPEYMQEVAPEFRENLRVVGKVKQKVDGPKLVAGKKAFVEDFVDADACVMKILRSPHAHAYIKSIDTADAEKTPGVLLVVTHKNCPDTYYTPAGQGFPEPSPWDMKMFNEKVRHHGDRVAGIIAETEEIALDAMKKIKVEYEVLPAVIDIDDAESCKAVVHDSVVEFQTGTPDEWVAKNKDVDPREGKVIYSFPMGGDPRKNVISHVAGGMGDIEQAWKDSDAIVERTFKSSQPSQTPLEPHVSYAKMDGDRIIVHASTQVPFFARRKVAQVLQIPENKVRVIKERIGGGYGSKQDVLLDELVAYGAYKTGRPVFLKYTRDEVFKATSSRHQMEIEMKIGAKKDGTLTGITMNVKSNEGAYGMHCLTVPKNAPTLSIALFVCPNVSFDIKTFYTNRLSGAYQGYGAPKGNYALGCVVAELADKIGMDRVEFIDKNCIKEGMNVELMKCIAEGKAGHAPAVNTCGLTDGLRQGAEMIDWSKKEESNDPAVKIGKGVAIIQQKSGLPKMDFSGADIKMLYDGNFMLRCGGADLGTGLDTVIVKVAAEVLQCDMDNVSVLTGDTDNTPYDTGAFASAGTYFAGNAALEAATDLKGQIIKAAAIMLEEPEEDLELTYPSTVKGKKGSVSYDEIAKANQGGVGMGEMLGHAVFTTKNYAFPYGANYAQVAVNTRTGEIDLQKFYALQDIGTPINPEIAMGQIYGGCLKAIGHSLWEDMVYDEDGHLLTSDLQSYGAPMMGDLPKDFKVKLVDRDEPGGPFGAKSTSEIATNGAAPAIANAIHDATGVWMTEWPFTPEKILKALGKI